MVLPAYIFRTVPELAQSTAVSFQTDSRVLWYVLGLSVAACVAFGLAPALHCTSVGIGRGLKSGPGSSMPSLKHSLPAYQVMISVILLVVAGLLVRSVGYAHTKDRGYSLDDVAVVTLEYPGHRSRALRTAFVEQLASSLENAAGSASVAAASVAPMTAGRSAGDTPMEIVAGGTRVIAPAQQVQVGGAYFDVLRIPIATGRAFDRSDTPDAAVMVNEAFVRRFWPQENPIGKTLVWDNKARTVVGVARDAHLMSLEQVDPLVFRPIGRDAHRVFLVRGERAASSLVESAARRIDPAVHVETIAGSEWLLRATRRSLLGARLIGALGAFALVLAAFGLFTVSAFVVQQRTHEIGIRMALGARPRHVCETVLRPAAAAMSRGCITGAIGAVTIAVVVRQSMFGFFGLSLFDWPTYAGVALVLLTSGIAAACVPAWRAMRCDPMIALRHE
jgi:putative ABC transport system permease protein